MATNKITEMKAAWKEPSRSWKSLTDFLIPFLLESMRFEL